MDKKNEYKISDEISEFEKSTCIKIILDIKDNNFKNFSDIVEFYLKKLREIKARCILYDKNYEDAIDNHKKEVDELEIEKSEYLGKIKCLLYENRELFVDYLKN
jgi:hypothetical protein